MTKWQDIMTKKLYRVIWKDNCGFQEVLLQTYDKKRAETVLKRVKETNERYIDYSIEEIEPLKESETDLLTWIFHYNKDEEGNIEESIGVENFESDYDVNWSDTLCYTVKAETLEKAKIILGLYRKDLVNTNNKDII